MKPYLLLLLAMVAGQSYAAGDCKTKDRDGNDNGVKGTYTGECKNGYAEGKGIYKESWLTSSGEERYVNYKGDWKDGKKWGVGHWNSDRNSYTGIYIKSLLKSKQVFISKTP